MFCVVILSVFFIFFFQAEDGIRDDLVTGVQTCALPILALPFVRILGQLSPQVTDGDAKYIEGAKPGMIYNRSEERRVGKECRSRGAPYH